MSTLIPDKDYTVLGLGPFFKAILKSDFSLIFVAGLKIEKKIGLK